MDYEEMKERMIAEQEDRRQVEGLVKLLWSGIIVAGALIAVGIVMLLTACHKDTDTTTGTAAVKVTVLRGQMFTAGANGGFTVNTSWIGDTNFVDF